MDVEAELEELRAAVASRDSALSALESQIAAQAVVLGQQAKQLERLAAVEAELAKLREQLGRNSSNSNKPPSSDPPGAKGQRRKKSKRLRGGQKGHRGSHRAMLEPDELVGFAIRHGSHARITPSSHGLNGYPRPRGDEPAQMDVTATDGSVASPPRG